MSLLALLSQLASGMPRRPGFRYASLYEYVATEGRPFESQKLTPSEWSLVRRLVRWDEIKQCFANAQAAIFLNDPCSTPFEYVEGFVLSGGGFPIHHGWLSLNGKVVDPTLRLHSTKPFRRQTYPDRVMGAMPDHWQYHGVTLPLPVVRRCILRNQALHTVLDDWKSGWPLLKGQAA